MANADQGGNPDRHVGGSCVHVKDCRIWAEINYLDSPTDYRECLPVSRSVSRHVGRGTAKHNHRHSSGTSDCQFGELEMLDTKRYYLKNDLTGPFLLVLAMILLFVSGYLVFRG